MKPKILMIAFAVLWLTQSAGAQTPKAGSDPVSGTWTGYMARDTDRMPITVTLALDGTAVSGSITGPPRPGTIKTGTFDRASGTLKFEVIVQDDSKPIALFEGKVVKDSASGRVTLDNATGTFNLTRGSADPAESALHRSFLGVSAYVMKAAALVPADKYSYRPTENVRTFGQLVGHVADSYNYDCARAAGRQVQWSDAIEKEAEKDAIMRKLEAAAEACSAVYSNAGQADHLIHNIAHTNLHYGNIITYMRMLGLVPPSS